MTRNSTGSTEASPIIDRALTVEEHQARAMLMGLWYASRIHCYRNGPVYGDETEVRGRATIRIDADTLEPVSGREAYARYQKWRDAND